MADDDFKVFVFENKQGSKKPKHIRTVLYDAKNDKIFIPIANDHDLLFAMFDATPIATFENHHYVELTWYEDLAGKEWVATANKKIRKALNI